MSNNPVHETRLQQNLTLEQASREAGCHLQAFFLQEQGAYPALLPVVAVWLSSKDVSVGEARVQYREYQMGKRKSYGEKYGFSVLELGPPDDTVHPFVEFRRLLPLSRLGFAKALCVHPGLLYRVETGVARTLPQQLAATLLEAGLSQRVIDDLRYRIEELCPVN